ncbi:hypothetical protein GCM10028807_52180 [Spirosoma daeguense]
MKSDFHHRTVLVADDDPYFRKILVHHLTKAGYKVLLAHDGQETLDWLNDPKQPLDILLLDLMMPQLSGLAVVTKYRERKQLLPIVLLSQAEPEIALQAAFMGKVDAYFCKPFSIEQLLGEMDRLIQLKQRPANSSKLAAYY